MAPRPNWKPRRTISELCTEREALSWYWRLLGVLSASMILVGFLLFPVSFVNVTDSAASQGIVSIISVVLLALGYSLSVALWFMCTSWLFQLDVLFMPCLFSCVLGLFNISIALGAHSFPQTQWTTSSISALALALASSAIYAALSILTHRKIAYTRHHHSRSRDSESLTLLPEDELQRQQLLRLLLQKESNKIPPTIAAQSTYRIDIPENSKVGSSLAPRPSYFSANPTTNQYVTTPTNIYEARGRSPSTLPLDSQYELLPPDFDRKPTALELARERAALTASRARDQSTGTPIIINSRNQYDIDQIPLAERHPLERNGAFIRGEQAPKSERFSDAVYRPGDGDGDEEDQDQDLDQGFSYSNPSRERSRAEFDLERGRRQVDVEVEGGFTPRILRVQTDGWDGR